MFLMKPGICNLWVFGEADSCVYMIGALEYGLDSFGLVIEKGFGNGNPVQDIGREFLIRIGLQATQGRMCGRGKFTTMGFMDDTGTSQYQSDSNSIPSNF